MHQPKQSKYTILLFCILPFSMMSQVINGKLYEEKTVAKHVKIINSSKGILSYSDDNGDFNIRASSGDSLIFSSVFYEAKTLVLNERHFNQTIAIQLKKLVNELDEVLLAETPKFKPYDAEKYEAEFKMQLENDKKNRPYLYNSYNAGGVDFIALAKLIGRLFKRKNRPDPVHYVTYKELDSFFNNNAYFNAKLLHDELKISEAYRFLFFDYCESRLITRKQLRGHQFVLLDSLISYSNDFNRILREEIKD